MLKIKPEFRELIPPLSDSEYTELEQSILAEGCREALITWNSWIVDGHHRYEICTKHNIPFRTQEKNFDSEEEAKVWIITNQLGRRNISDFSRIELALMRKDILLEIGKKKKQLAGKEARDKQLGVLLQNNKTPDQGFMMSEHDEQVALFEWAAIARPELRWMFAIPNGGQRNKIVAARLKQEGVKKGIPDVCLLIPSNGYHALFIEMKVGHNKLTPEQKQFFHDATQQGYCCRVAYSAEEAIELINEYLGSEVKDD